jgi:putative N6-adenine-specific DNA methylase
MAKFLALTSRGLEPALLEELVELGVQKPKLVGQGVEFESNWEGCYRANLQLRTATRVILPILDFPAYQNEDLYNNIKRHDFTKYISPEQTLAVDAKVRDSRTFRDQRFVALKVKDAIVDQFRERFGKRPNVDPEKPDMQVMVRVVQTKVSVAIDTSGESLSHRGYREKSVMAPLREHLAAGLLRMAEWNPEIPLVDPMCGSGTFLIEAALRAKNVPAGVLRKHFAFEYLKNFQPEIWRKVKGQAETQGRDAKPQLFGFDKSPEAIRAARQNAARAGVTDLVRFKVGDVKSLVRPVESGMLIVNPPYGERLGAKESLATTYENLASTMKNEFKGWSCWLLSGDEEATKALHLKTSRKIRVYNGTIECRFLRYDMF